MDSEPETGTDEQPDAGERPSRRGAASRVWAEQTAPGEIRLTWRRPESDVEVDHAADARAVAATLGVRPGVASADVDGDAVRVTFDPEVVSKQDLALAVRSALSLDADLKTRGNELMKRTPAYLKLTRTLALDERVSPAPEAARQLAASRGTSLRTAGALPVAARFIPGFPLIARLQTLVPVLRALSSWSREASPEVVDEHLARAGLSRQQLDADLATSQEAIAFAKDYAAAKASRAVSVASSAALQARAKAREWQRKRDGVTRRDPAPDSEPPDVATPDDLEPDPPTPRA